MKRYIRSNTYNGELGLYRNKQNENKYIEVKKARDGHTYFRQFMYWNTDTGPVKNYSGSKTNRGRFHRVTLSTLNKVLEDYEKVDSVHEEEDTFSSVKASRQIRTMPEEVKEHFQGLLEHILYDTWDNYKYDDYSKREISEIVAEHAEMIINDMDDDGVWEDVLPYAQMNNRSFMKAVRDYVNEYYDNYNWDPS